MTIVLYLPVEQVISPPHFSLTCHKGKCMKYINKEKLFCRCNPGWSGSRCDIPVRRNDCSNDSIYVGMISNRSICVCPLNKGGPRCLFRLLCSDKYCHNGGHCVVLNYGIDLSHKVCPCSEQFNGLYCGKEKHKLEISFYNIEISSFLSIHIFSAPMLIFPDTMWHEMTR